jgi:ABC-2 type transport system permease protein
MFLLVLPGGPSEHEAQVKIKYSVQDSISYRFVLFNSIQKIISIMQTNIPSTSTVVSSLLRADFITLWRNRRGVMMSLIIPVTILIAWKGLIEKLGGAFIISNSITLGLTTIGLMAYSNSIARDRDKGVFQRLRVAPLPTWSIMMSRISVQCGMIVIMSVIVFLSGFYADQITLRPMGYIVGLAMAFVGGAVFLSMGQAVVGLIKNAETVSATSRLVYTVFIMLGMLGELGVFGKEIGEFVKWSPYGSVLHILASGMLPETWDGQSYIALVVSIGYAVLFSSIGIKWFRWDSR